MFSVERNARTDNLHIANAVMPQWLAWTKRYAVLLFQYDFLLKEKVHEFMVRREFIIQLIHYLTEEIMKGLFS